MKDLTSANLSSVSTLSGSTLNALPILSACNFARVGISTRHGAHQVAQTLSSTTLPLKSLSRTGFLSRSIKPMSAMFCGAAKVCKCASEPLA